MRAAESSEDRRVEVDQVLDNLRRIVRVLYGHSHRLESLAGLTSAQAWLITTLSKMQPAEVSVLARAMHLGPPAVVRIVGRLEERGLVVGNRSLNERVNTKVALTDLGKRLAGRIPANPQELLLKGLSEIPRKRLRAVSDGLESLARILDAKEMTPLLFFALVANLPAGESVSGRRVARPRAMYRKRTGRDPGNMPSGSGRSKQAARKEVGRGKEILSLPVRPSTGQEMRGGGYGRRRKGRNGNGNPIGSKKRVP